MRFWQKQEQQVKPKQLTNWEVNKIFKQKSNNLHAILSVVLCVKFVGPIIEDLVSDSDAEDSVLDSN